MKICMLLSTSLFWGMAASALCQDHVGTRMTDPTSAAAPDYYLARNNYSAADRCYEEDCQVPWSTYPRGYLWENYCFEKRPCLAGDVCRPHAGRTALCEPGRSCRPSRASSCECRSIGRQSKLERERIICFDLFFELLGWNQCSCCTQSCRHRDSCCDCLTSQHVDSSLAPVPVPEDEPTDAARPRSREDAPESGKREEALPSEPAAVPDDPQPDTADTPPAAEGAETQDPDPLEDPPPVVPRNTLPPIEPAQEGTEQQEPTAVGSSSSHAPLHGMVVVHRTMKACEMNKTPGTNKVFVAERLSDYIQTR